MAEKSKSKAARAFGIKQTIQNILINILLFLILVGAGQLAFHYFTGLRWIGVYGAEEIATELEDQTESAGQSVSADLTTESIDGLVARSVRKRASINFPEKGQIKWDLVYMGSFKDPNESMVDRYEVRFKYPLETKLLHLVNFRTTFRGKAYVKTKRNSSLRPLATASEAS